MGMGAPHIPFYCYSTVFLKMRVELLSRGVQVVPIFGSTKRTPRCKPAASLDQRVRVSPAKREMDKDRDRDVSFAGLWISLGLAALSAAVLLGQLNSGLFFRFLGRSDKEQI